MNNQLRRIAAGVFSLGLVAALGLTVALPAGAPVDAIADDAVTTTQVASTDAETLSDWEFTRARRFSRCRFDRSFTPSRSFSP
ncbi:hypothetical protein [Crateriforma spongiae]|uniref:hypothetical protein n=1 Tax=Crateriforma spongiae TaxID=2724528 RepID=UPI00197D41BD|nr:hypothetical protein [Crateriforma spongiae]